MIPYKMQKFLLHNYTEREGDSTMAKKSWSVTTDEGTYSVDLKGSKVSINGNVQFLNVTIDEIGRASCRERV